MAHAVVHFEIGGPDLAELSEFYSDLLGWRVQPVPDIGYGLVDTRGGQGINGGIGTRDDMAGVSFYIQADDLQAVLDKVNLLGGKTEAPITDLPGMVTYAKFSDLDGLVVGLVLGPADPGRVQSWQPDGMQPTAPGPTPGPGAPVDWFEVLGSDADRTQRFYAEIFGWQISGAGQPYGTADTGSERGIRGGIGTGQAGPLATVYARVPDVAATLARAQQLGGRPDYGPVVIDEHTQTGALRDPAGGVFGVYSRRPH